MSTSLKQHGKEAGFVAENGTYLTCKDAFSMCEELRPILPNANHLKLWRKQLTIWTGYNHFLEKEQLSCMK